MVAARSYRLTAFLVIIAWIIALSYLHRFCSFSDEPTSSNLSEFTKVVLSSSFSFNKTVTRTNPDALQIDVGDAGHYAEDSSPEQIHWDSVPVDSGKVSLDPTQIARVAYEGMSLLLECHAKPREIIVTSLFK
jgi:hypothetical protein